MKYCVLIMDGSAGLPIPERGGKTSLELARTPNLDAMASEGSVGLAHNVPREWTPIAPSPVCPSSAMTRRSITPAERPLRQRVWALILCREKSFSAVIP